MDAEEAILAIPVNHAYGPAQVKIALGQFDLGKAAAMSLVYNLIILAICWVFYTVMTNVDADRERVEA